MKKITISLAVLVFATGAFAQTRQTSGKKTSENKPTKTTASSSAVTKNSTPLELAKAALSAHGGDKFKNMKTLVVRGTVDVSGSPTQVFPGTFVTVFAGEKYRLEINSLQSFKQTFDGRQTASSTRGFELPPLNRLGLPLLAKIGEKDFDVSALSPEKAKKKTGFRITAPEGFYTDFFVDEKTGLINAYESSYEIGERTATTSVAIDKVRDVDGVKIPERYAQRLDFGSLTAYADFKAKEILVNSTVADDVFSIGK